ncbi:MAG: hypothetical protein QOI74_2810, partial [Micromonosporaceae bacterium]|nr:hypothetical protein [Micromonosporaceae bacterium]
LLMFADRPAESLAVLDAAAPLIDDDRRRARWVGIRSIVAYWGLSDAGTVEQIAREGAALTDPTAGNWVRAVESIMRSHHGEYAAALGLAHRVLADRHSDAGSRALAASTVGHLGAARGTPVQTMRSMAAVDAEAPRWRADAPYLQLAVELARGTAAILAGDLAAVDTVMAAEFAGLADAGEFRLGSGYLSLVRAQAARLRGQLRDAGRYAGTAAAALATSRMYGALANAERAHVAALSGQTALAADAIAEADRAHRPTMTILYPWLEQARSWVATAAGDRGTGAEVLHRLVRRLRADRFAAHELHALYDLVRLGHAAPAVSRMTELAPTVEGPLPALMVRHARAAADADGDELLAVAEDFAELGLTLYAAEATGAAIPLLRAGRAPRTSNATELLATLVARCDGVGTVTLAVTQPSLTGRERQIARLAAAGVPSKEIADQLYLSARTVDNHLLRVYAKLGIAGRAELAVALRAVPADAP